MPLGLPPLRSALPFRLRCAVSAQSGAATPSAPDVTALAEPRTAPSRCASGATVVAADPRPGVAVAPPAPRPHSAPFRSPARHRLLVCPATTPVPTNQRQRGETPPPVSAPGKPGARLPSPTRRANNAPGPRSRPPRNLRVGSSRGPPSCAGGLRCSPRPTRLETSSSSFAQAHSRRNANARHQRACPPFAPAPAVPGPARARAGEASARAMALRRPRLRPASCPRPSSSRPFACPTSRVAGFSVTAAACGGRTIRRYAKRALFRASSRHSVGPEHSLRCAPSRYISRDCAIRRRGSLRALLISGARTNVTGAEPPPPWKFERRYRANK